MKYIWNFIIYLVWGYIYRERNINISNVISLRDFPYHSRWMNEYTFYIKREKDDKLFIPITISYKIYKYKILFVFIMSTITKFRGKEEIERERERKRVLDFLN